MQQQPPRYAPLLQYLLTALPRPVRADRPPECCAPWRRLASLAEARAHPHGVVAIYGDSGGQTYVVAPARLVAQSESGLQQLLLDLDRIAWGNSHPHSRFIDYLAAPVGSWAVGGGMGGDIVVPGIWVHAEFVVRELVEEITEVILGDRACLDPALVDRHAADHETWVGVWHWLHDFQRRERDARHPALRCDVVEVAEAAAAQRWQVLHRASQRVVGTWAVKGHAYQQRNRYPL